MTLRTPWIGPRVTWSTLPDRPSTFPPSPHTHPWGDLTAVPASFPPAAHTHVWADVTGKPTSYPPSTHTHSYNDLTDKPTIPVVPTGGRLIYIGDVTVAETLLLALGAGTRRKTLALAGVLATDRLMYASITPCAAGCEAVNVYAASAGQVIVAYSTPALGIGAIVNIPIAVYRVTT